MLRFIPNKTAVELEKLMKLGRGQRREQLRPRSAAISGSKEIYADEGPTMRGSARRPGSGWSDQQADLQHHGHR